MKSHLMTLNDFNMPKVLEGTYSMYTNLIYLILLEPGKFQSHPTMGVGLKSRWRYNNEEGFLFNLQREIQSQIERFLPSLTSVKVSLAIQDTLLHITINTETAVYELTYNSSTDELNSPATYVLDEL